MNTGSCSIAIITNDNISPTVINEIIRDIDTFNIFTVSFTDIKTFSELFNNIYNYYDKIYIFVYNTVGIIDKWTRMSFYPLDYVGGDLKYEYMGINKLLEITINDDRCVAFNTKGYLKQEVQIQNLKPNNFLGENGGIFIYNDKCSEDNIQSAGNGNNSPQIFIQTSLIHLIPTIGKGINFNLISTKKKKLKVALCISGQPRFYNSASFESLCHFIINEYDTDVFIHTWISKNPDYKYECAPWSKIKSIDIPSTTETELKFLYKPKEMKVEEPRIFSEFYIEGNYSANNFPSMFYSLQQADMLRRDYEKTNMFKYDYVIRARTDTLLKSFVDLALLDKNYIHIPNNCPNTICYNDNFSIAGRNISDKCYNVFDILPEHFIEGKHYAEGMWLKNIEINKLQVNLIDIEQSFVRE